MPKILSITTHMGGGVGKALAGIAVYNLKNNTGYKHKILMLEKPERMQFIDQCIKNGVDIAFCEDEAMLADELRMADIVLLNWWHHPLMAAFMHCFPQCPVRLVLWSHVSGCTYPELPFELVKTVHKTFFATRYSYDNPYWVETQRSYARENAVTVYGLGELNMRKVQKHFHNGFNIGYVGTLNYSKLNPDFARYCAAVDIPDTKFIMVGDTSSQKIIEDDANGLKVKDKLCFTGYTTDVAGTLENFDIFGYILNSWHFGATENALLEAMAAGLPVVTLDQCAEKYIIKNMETGLLVHNESDYARSVRYLYGNPAERERMGNNAREYILEEFSMDKNVLRMNNAFDQVMEQAPRIFSFDKIFGSEPYEWFITCLGADREKFKESLYSGNISNCRHIFKENSKSSVFHFAKYYPSDKYISQWKEMVEV